MIELNGRIIKNELRDHFEYWIGDIVYLRTDNDQRKRIVTGIIIRDTGIQYDLACGGSDSWHYAFEMTVEVDIMITSTH